MNIEITWVLISLHQYRYVRHKWLEVCSLRRPSALHLLELALRQIHSDIHLAFYLRLIRLIQLLHFLILECILRFADSSCTSTADLLILFPLWRFPWFLRQIEHLPFDILEQTSLARGRICLRLILISGVACLFIWNVRTHNWFYLEWIASTLVILVRNFW